MKFVHLIHIFLKKLEKKKQHKKRSGLGEKQLPGMTPIPTDPKSNTAVQTWSYLPSEILVDKD